MFRDLQDHHTSAPLEAFFESGRQRGGLPGRLLPRRRPAGVPFPGCMLHFVDEVEGAVGPGRGCSAESTPAGGWYQNEPRMPTSLSHFHE